MIVEVKKIKINKSIFEQILRGSSNLYHTYENYEILGWCLHRKVRHILLQNKETNALLRLPYISTNEKDITLISKSGGWIYPTVKFINVYFPDLNSHQNFEQQLQSDEEFEQLYSNVKRFAEIVQEKGQIFL